ncbi:LuxR family transcriptional regulator [Xylophilus sp. Kf1]|nr:LuxR family transcriptional regulator [Xylophilus sp. Kf1]
MASGFVAPAVSRPEQHLLARVVSRIGLPGFAHDALAGLGGLLAIGSWSVYELLPGRPPRMHLSASLLPVDTTAACFATYRDDGLYRHDRSFDPARHGAGGDGAVLLKTGAGDMAEPHRRAIYERHAMLERLSVVQPDAGGGMLAVNLYRHLGQGCFAAADVEHLAAVALPLLAAVRRHIECVGAADPAAGARDWLRRHRPGLTDRELDVMELLLRGLTYDGIAVALGLGVGTVKTYRARAFERLGIHFKNELFALVMRAGLEVAPA